MEAIRDVLTRLPDESRQTGLSAVPCKGGDVSMRVTGKTMTRAGAKRRKLQPTSNQFEPACRTTSPLVDAAAAPQAGKQ